MKRKWKKYKLFFFQIHIVFLNSSVGQPAAAAPACGCRIHVTTEKVISDTFTLEAVV